MEEKFISSSFEVLTKENFGNWLESNELYFNPEKINEIWNTLEKNFGTKITKNLIRNIRSDLTALMLPLGVQEMLRKWNQNMEIPENSPYFLSPNNQKNEIDIDSLVLNISNLEDFPLESNYRSSENAQFCNAHFSDLSNSSQNVYSTSPLGCSNSLHPTESNNNDSEEDMKLEWIYPGKGDKTRSKWKKFKPTKKQKISEEEWRKEFQIVRNQDPPKLVKNKQIPFPRLVNVPPNSSKAIILIKGKKKKSTNLLIGNEVKINSHREAEFIDFKVLETSHNTNTQKYEGWVFIFEVYDKENKFVKSISTKSIIVVSHVKQTESYDLNLSNSAEIRIEKLVPADGEVKKNHSVVIYGNFKYLPEHYKVIFGDESKPYEFKADTILVSDVLSYEVKTVDVCLEYKTKRSNKLKFDFYDPTSKLFEELASELNINDSQEENNIKDEMEEESTNEGFIENDERSYPSEFLVQCSTNCISELTNFRDHKGFTFLHWSSGLGDEKLTKYCLENGFDINAEDYYGSTPLYWAVWNENQSMVSLLLSYKDKLNLDINLGNDYGITPLHLAYQFKNEELVQLLLQNGASNEIKDIYGNIPSSFDPSIPIRETPVHSRRNSEEISLDQTRYVMKELQPIKKTFSHEQVDENDFEGIYSKWGTIEEIFVDYEEKLNSKPSKPIECGYISAKCFEYILKEYFYCKSVNFFLSLFVKDNKVKLLDLEDCLQNFLPICTTKHVTYESHGKFTFDKIKLLLDSPWFFMKKEEGDGILGNVDQLETPFYICPKGGGSFSLVIKTINKRREVNIESTGTHYYLDSDLIEPEKGSKFESIFDIIKSPFQFHDQRTPFYLKEFPVSRTELERYIIEKSRLSQVESTSEQTILTGLLDEITPVILRELIPKASTLQQALWNSNIVALKLTTELASKNPYIIPLKGIYEHEGAYYIVSEQYIGTLATQKIMDPKQQISIAYQLAFALRNLNSERIPHLDLVSSNVFLYYPNDKCFKYKACISGFQKNMQFTSSQVEHDSIVPGPPFYSINSPPEFFDEDKKDWKPSDYFKANIYSYGCILYEMIGGNHPFKNLLDLNDLEKYEKIKSIFRSQCLENLFLNNFTFLVSQKFKIRKLDALEPLLQILNGCLCFNPSKRWTWEIIIERLEQLKNSFEDLEISFTNENFDLTKEQIFEFLLIKTQVPERILQNILTSNIDGVQFSQLSHEKLDSIGIKMIKFQDKILEAKTHLFTKSGLNPQLSQSTNKGYDY